MINHPKDAYTVVIFRGATASPLRFSIPRKLVHGVLGIAIVFIVAECVFLTQYALQSGEIWELRAFRQEHLSVRAQTEAFSNALQDLKRRLLAMKEVNQRLRVMMGIDPIKSEDILNGKGGADLPLENTGQAPVVPITVVEPEPEPGEEARQLNNLGPDLTQTAVHLNQELHGMLREVTSQERSLEELTSIAKERLARLAATPSVRPVHGWVTSGFGPRVSPFTGLMAMHDGVDIGAPPNSPIKSPASGVVTVIGFDPKMGNVVNIDHGHGIQTQYGHLARYLVRQGQRVKRGEILGLVGNTGHSTGPHLHYMVKVNGRTVNPQIYILE